MQQWLYVLHVCSYLDKKRPGEPLKYDEVSYLVFIKNLALILLSNRDCWQKVLW